MLWKIRSATSEDISFIYATWLPSYFVDTSYYKTVRNRIYYTNYREVIDNILLNARIDVACKEDEPNVIFGYMVSEPEIAHYIFIKEPFRGFKIARALYSNRFGKDDLVIITHQTKHLRPLIEHKENIVFNPFKLYKGM